MGFFTDLWQRWRPRNWPWTRGGGTGGPRPGPGFPHPRPRPGPTPGTPLPVPSGGGTPAPGTPSPAGPSPDGPGTTPTFQAKLLALTNRDRFASGLPPLAGNDRLTAAAMRYAQILAAAGHLDHSVDGSSPGGRIAAQGYAWQREGENIAAGQTSEEQVEQEWMASPGHRQNILGPYHDVGFGMAQGQSGIFWVTDFGLSMDQTPHPYRGVIQGFISEVAWDPPGLDSRSGRERASILSE